MIQDIISQTAASKQWSRIGIKNHHGICLPLFSLRSKKSGGIGEFPDLLPLIDWCKEVGMDVIQLLPLNDPGWGSSPYSAISAFALNPLYLGLSSLPDASQFASLLEELSKLNQEPRVNYPRVHDLKRQFLRLYYKEKKKQIQKSPSYMKFVDENAWLEGYSLFKTIKREYDWQDSDNWPEEIKNLNFQMYSKLIKKYHEEIDYHTFVQFLCFEQLTHSHDYANEQQVFLKGDIPILISRDSADVWLDRSIFDKHLSAGSPPDAFSAEGQNWGFPLYRWDVLERQNYNWWKERLTVAQQYYDIYRIDHVVGFYRIWASPLGVPSRNGGFVPPDQREWIPLGEKNMLMLINSSSMLPIGEDLGTIPPEVRVNLKNLGICGTKVIRWERKYHEDRSYINPKDYPPESMTTVSTHDTETLQQWWELEPEEAKEFARFKRWNYSIPLTLEQRKEILYDSLHSGSLFHINLFQEFLAMFPDLVWSNPSDERINIPALVSDRNWTYRTRPWLEDIVAHSALKESINLLLK